MGAVGAGIRTMMAGTDAVLGLLTDAVFSLYVQSFFNLVLHFHLHPFLLYFHRCFVLFFLLFSFVAFGVGQVNFCSQFCTVCCRVLYCTVLN